MERYQASSVEGMTVDWGLAEKVANQIANRAPFNDVSYLKGCLLYTSPSPRD